MREVCVLAALLLNALLTVIPSTGKEKFLQDKTMFTDVVRVMDREEGVRGMRWRESAGSMLRIGKRSTAGGRDEGWERAPAAESHALRQ